MKMRSWNLHFGNKGLIFTLDAIAALTIVMTILIVSNIYILNSVNELPNLETLKTGYDVITILDYKKTLDSLNANNIKSEIDGILPKKYNMLIRLTSVNQTISIGSAIPNDRFIGSGKRFSVIANSGNATYLTTTFWIWLR